jgi:hypothetical protein
MYTARMNSDRVTEINGKLDAAGAKDACLACGCEDRIIDPSAETALVALDGLDLDVTRAIPTISIICTRCGFVHLHSSRHLLTD